MDVDVKNGANLLDRLVKDIVTESESFDVDKFIPLLQKYIRMTNPYIRQLMVGWITVLDSVPDIDMLDYLPGARAVACDPTYPHKRSLCLFPRRVSRWTF